MFRSVSAHSRAGRLLLSGAVALALVIGLCVASAISYLSATRLVEHTLDVRNAVYEWKASLLDAETGARGYVATGRVLLLEPYERSLGPERQWAARLRALVADNARQVRNVDEADRDAREALADLTRLVDQVQSGHQPEAVEALAAGVNKRHMDSFRTALDLVASEEERLLGERRQTARARGRVTLTAAGLLALVALSLLAVARKREREYASTIEALSKEATQHLSTLSDLGTALANARTRAEVSEAICDLVTSAAEADVCTLYQLDEQGNSLELISHRGVASEILDRVRRLTEATEPSVAFASIKARRPTWAENIADYAALRPDLVKSGAQAQAFWCVPLFAEGRPIGLLGAGFHEPRRFSKDERAFVQTLADQCAQALLRASRMQREEQARRWLATTMRSIGDAVIATDAEGHVAFMNPVAEELTGWIESDARGRSLDEVFPIFSELTRKPVESPVTKVLREGTVVGLANHTVLRSKRGHETPIDDSGAPIRSEDGRVLGVVLVFRDATQEKHDRARSDFLAKAGEALASSLDYQATLAMVARLAVPALADGCTVDLLELASSPAVAHSVLAHAEPQSMVVPLRAGGRTFGTMTFVYSESGRRYSQDDLAFAEDFARRAAMAIENARALKEAKDARESERTLRHEAELGSRAKDEFLATVSHELRTPLNAILGWSVVLRSRKPEAEVDRALGIIERNARAQAKLIDDVLDLSRIISGKLALNLGPTNVAEAIAAAIETVTPAAQAKEIEIRPDTVDASLTITADGGRMQQIVWNLLSNAVKFTPRGGVVTVDAGRDGSDVLVRVRDTGEGIPPEALRIIFEPFQQADASTTRRHGGLGLGLSIVRQIVAAHGGTVRASSEGPGKGATFEVRLPARSALPAVTRPVRPLPSVEGAPAPQGSPRIDGLRLLVIDDEQDALALVGEVLRARGAQVYVARSAKEALEKIAAVRPDVIVSDIGMPDVDGYSLMRTIRALPPEAGGRTPAVALTAYARAEDAQRAFVAGYQMHVAKPVEPTRLATVVANLGGRVLE
jgi:PAS domain S-box-containing protein